jgi:hypothetical protein
MRRMRSIRKIKRGDPDGMPASVGGVRPQMSGARLADATCPRGVGMAPNAVQSKCTFTIVSAVCEIRYARIAIVFLRGDNRWSQLCLPHQVTATCHETRGNNDQSVVSGYVRTTYDVEPGISLHGVAWHPTRRSSLRRYMPTGRGHGTIRPIRSPGPCRRARRSGRSSRGT